MNWRDLPSLSALRAFSAFAENGNVSAAGDALGVSHAAISQQLRALEAHLGTALLDRSGRSLTLTPDGKRLADALHKGFGGISVAVAEITGAQDLRPLHVSVTPTFAASWLMPRLLKFRQAHADIDLMIDPSPALVDLTPGGIDVAIRYGEGPWAGVTHEMLLRSPMVVVGAPGLVGQETFEDLSDLGHFPWLEEFGTSEATQWMRRHGVERRAHAMVQVPGNLRLDGARDGQGIIVTVEAFVARDIAAGRLRILHTEAVDGGGYQIVTLPGVLRSAAKAFVTWLRREARADAQAASKRVLRDPA
ncbi:MAG: LysR family transcriptional regulator [Pseudomonadota bacterium]